MSKEAEKLFHGITNIDDDLIIELEKTIAQQALLSKRIWGGILRQLDNRKVALVASAVLVCLVLIIAFTNGKMSSTPIKDNGTTPIVSTGSNTQGEIVVGKRDGERLAGLNAEELSHIRIDDSQFIKLEKAITKHADYEEIRDAVEGLIETDTNGFLLTDMDNLGVSTFNVTKINLNDASIANVAYEFLFSNGEPVGLIEFYLVNGELAYSIALDATSASNSYVHFLQENKNKSFIILTDGFSDYFLSEDNMIYNPSTGNEVKRILIDGDCYQAFESEQISVSYEKIVNELKNIS